MITADNISFSYKDKKIITDFSLKIADNDKICFFGPSGSGKTTLLRLFAGLEKPTAGKIVGIENLKYSIVFQDDRLLPQKTVKENIMLFADCDPDEIIERLGLNDSQNYLPKQLSGGMARRVAIARALARKSDVLILDEPFTGLDSKLINAAAKLINEYSKDRTVLLVTHSKAEAELLGAKIINI